MSGLNHIASEIFVIIVGTAHRGNPDGSVENIQLTHGLRDQTM